GHKRDKPRDGDIPARKGGPEAVRPLVLVSDSNGSRSVTTSATLDRWHRVSAESDSWLFAINARKSLLAWLAVGHHGKAFRVGFFTRGDRRGPDCRESDCCEAAMVRHASPAKSPATRISVAVMLTVAIAGALWVPIYAHSLPKLGDFPFFYWYQLILVPVTAILCWICYLLLRTKPAPRASAREREGARR